jgi:3-methyladenine DNA glycosylase AlkD
VNVLYPLMLCQPGDVLPLLETWNRSPNPWARRASVVPFTHKVGASGRFTQDCLRLCEGLVWDLVRKGVSWVLMDIRDLRQRDVSAVITLNVLHDLKGAQQAELLAIHKA